MKNYWKLAYKIILLTVIFGTIAVVGQQMLRMNADDPQIQLAEDAAAALDAGVDVSSVTKGHADMAKSLAPFIIVYDKQGKTVGGNGFLDDALPVVPIGVLKASEGQAYHAVTWEPDGMRSVRIASVSVAGKQYYVLSGRNMHEVESRVQRVMALAAFGWLCSLLVVLFASYLQTLVPAKRSRK